MRTVVKRIKKILGRNNGVSLIEVLAAVTILGIIAIPFSSVFMQTFKMSNDSNLKSIASQTAVKYMEKYKNDESVPEPVTGDYILKTTIKKETDSSSAVNLNVVTIISVLNEKEYSLGKRDGEADGYFDRQSLYNITVEVYKDNAKTEKTTVSGFAKDDLLAAVTGLKK